MLFLQISFAQEETPESPAREGSLPQNKLKMIKALRTLVKENKEAFGSTLSDGQLAILGNKEFSLT